MEYTIITKGTWTSPRSLRHFPYKNSNGDIDLPHLRNAIARIPQSKIEGMSDEEKQKLQDKARKILEEETNKGKTVEQVPHIVPAGDIESSIKILRAEAVNRVDQLTLIAKEGRVLSGQNRTLLSTCIVQLKEAIQAVQDLLDATDMSKSYSILTDLSAELMSALSENFTTSANISALLNRGYESTTKSAAVTTEPNTTRDGGQNGTDNHGYAGGCKQTDS